MGEVGSRGGEDSDGTAGACEFDEHRGDGPGELVGVGKLVEKEEEEGRRNRS